MTFRELKTIRADAKVSRRELAEQLPKLRLPKFSAAMIQRIEDGEKPVPEEYEAVCIRALNEITRRRHAKLLKQAERAGVA